MTRRGLAAVGALLLILSGALALHAATAVGPAVASGPEFVPDMPAPTRRIDALQDRISIDSIVNHNLFRHDRKAPDTRSSGRAEEQRALTAGLRLWGVVVGMRSAALLGGLPGLSSPRLLAQGDTVAGVHLISVNDSAALVQIGPDSVRVFLVRHNP